MHPLRLLALGALLVAPGACSSSSAAISAPRDAGPSLQADSGGGDDASLEASTDAADEGDVDAASDTDDASTGAWGSVCYFYNPGGTAAKPDPGQCGALLGGPISAAIGGCFLSNVIEMGEYVGFCTFRCYDPSADSGALDTDLVAMCTALGGSCDSDDGGLFTGDCVPPGGFEDGGR